MRVLFYQPAHTGHHFAYLSRMLPGFVDLPIDILLATTPEAVASVEFQKSLAPFGSRLQVLADCTRPPKGALKNSRHRLKELAKIVQDVRPDHLAVCYADGLWDQAYLVTLLGRRPWPRDLPAEGWLYRGRFGETIDRRLKSRIRRRMFTGLLHRGLFQKLHLHHELLYNFVKTLAPETPTEVVLAPDPIVIGDPLTTQDARQKLGVVSPEVAGAKWVGVAGMIARFKGAHLLLDAFRIRREQAASPPIKLLLAGPHDEDIRVLLRQSPYREEVAAGNIVSVDRFLSEDEMYWAASACDLVVAPYPHHQNRSSIILWAAAAGRPCLGTEDSCVGYVIRQEQLGSTCNVLDTPAMAAAIGDLLTAPWTAEDAARVRNYANFHRMENYQAISSQLVRERLGLL